MAKQKSGNKMWIAGAVLGAVAGAAYALWKTPMSGEELRGKLSTGPVEQSNVVATDTVRTPNTGDKLLGKLEQTLAPIVGVQLGKTANGPAPTRGTVTEPIAVVTPPAEAEAATEPAPAANAATTDFTGQSFRTRRYEWGTPAPEATEAAEPAQPEPPIEPAAPIVEELVEKAKEPEDAAAVSTGYGTETLRSKQYRWGEPAPESTTIAATDATVEIETVQEAAAPATTAVENSPLEAVSAASAVGNNKRQFPKLGGLES